MISSRRVPPPPPSVVPNTAEGQPPLLRRLSPAWDHLLEHFPNHPRVLEFEGFEAWQYGCKLLADASTCKFIVDGGYILSQSARSSRAVSSLPLFPPPSPSSLLPPGPAPSSLRCPQHQGDCGRWPANGARGRVKPSRGLNRSLQHGALESCVPISPTPLSHAPYREVRSPGACCGRQVIIRARL